MKRKLSNSNEDRLVKRARILSEHDVCCPELPSEIWFNIFDALIIHCYERKHCAYFAWIELALLSSTSKRLLSECQKFKQIKSLVPEEHPTAFSFMNYFAELCSLSCLKYAHERGLKMGPYQCHIVISRGNIECLKYLLSIGTPAGELLEVTACHAPLECVKFVYEYQGGKWCQPHQICGSAASGKQLDVLKFVHQNGGELNVKVCEDIAKHGRLDMLQYVRDHGCPWNDKVYCEAAFHGHVHILKHAHENGCPWNYPAQESCFRRATSKGHLDVLKYLYQIRGFWCSDTCIIAARDDQLECLIYARQHGAEWDRNSVVTVAENHGSKKVLEYLRSDD